MGQFGNLRPYSYIKPYVYDPSTLSYAPMQQPTGGGSVQWADVLNKPTTFPPILDNLVRSNQLSSDPEHDHQRVIKHVCLRADGKVGILYEEE